MTTKKHIRRRRHSKRSIIRNFINLLPSLVMLVSLAVAIVFGVSTIIIKVKARICEHEIVEELKAKSEEVHAHCAELEAENIKLEKENLERELAYQKTLQEKSEAKTEKLKEKLQKVLEEQEQEKQKWLEEQRKKDEQIKQLQLSKATKNQTHQTQTLQGNIDSLTFSLGKIIYAEAGSNTCSDLEQQYVGYVVLNRMASSLFAGNTIEEVFFSEGYAKISQQRYRNNEYNERSLRNAQICIQNYNSGSMPVSKALVYQAGFPQGINSFQIGTTYFGYEPKLMA